MPEHSPIGAHTLDEFAERLSKLRLSAGAPSYAEIARRVGVIRERRGYRTIAPGKVTVYDAFRPGRTRIDIELVADIVSALGFAEQIGDWRSAHSAILRAVRRGVTVRARPVVEKRPPTTTELTGRGDLIDSIVTSDTNRVVLSGFPGVGKTVIARAAAQRLGSGLVVELSLRSYAREGEQQTAEPADLRDELHAVSWPDRPGQLSVLIADDVATDEQLDLIREATPDSVVVLATSRRRLRTDSGELMMEIPPLAPDDAVSLLRQRSQLAATEQDIEALRRLVALCGEIPLAIELLAGQLDRNAGWSLEDHLVRLQNEHSESVLPSLAVAYAALPAPARAALNLLARHPAALSLTQIQVFLRSIDGASEAIFELVADLFIRKGEDGRYRMHDLVRALAAQRALTEQPLARRRRAIAGLIDALETDLNEREQSAAGLAEVSADAEVYLGSVQMAYECGVRAHVVRLAAALFDWFAAAERWNDVITMHKLAREAASGDERGVVVQQLVTALTMKGRLDEADVTLSTYAREVGVTAPSYPGLLDRLHTIAVLRADHDRALGLAREGLSLAESRGDNPSRRLFGAQVTESLIHLGRSDEAVREIEKTLAIPAEPSVRDAVLLSDRGIALMWSDRLGEAAVAAVEAIAEAEKFGVTELASYGRAWQGMVMMLRGDREEGLETLAEAHDALAATERLHIRAVVATMLAVGHLMVGDPATARDLSEGALVLCRRHRLREFALSAQVVLAWSLAQQGDFDAAEPLLLDVAAEDTSPVQASEALAALLTVARRRGDDSEVARLRAVLAGMKPTPLLQRRLRANEK